MPSFRTGTVVEVLDTTPRGVQRLRVRIEDEIREAVLYPRWAAPATAGDTVVVNTTAIELELGTGGADFVVWNNAVTSYDAESGGHIMKLRYTPAQCDVLAVESPESPHHATMSHARSLHRTPIVATSLHSQLLPVMCGLREHGQLSVAYVMTDGAALEAGFSNTLSRLRELDWLCGVVTSGHAVGGDLESVTLHSGLLAACHVMRADVIVAGPGPGVVGTETPFGTTALDLGTTAMATLGLGGRSVVCVRLSEADERARHHGLSHHVQAALSWVPAVIDRSDACVVVPPGWGTRARERLAPWPVVEQAADGAMDTLRRAAEDGLDASHMGRGFDKDAVFFASAAAAGVYAAGLAAEA